jgi:aryl-alcohol dehydrogenase-like predicted oxidoreductase
MQKIVLPGTDLILPRFVFGTGGLFNAGSRARRRWLLDAAVDNGLTHFDTAPYYGFGLAESDLAPLLERNPQVTVTTKVGIYSPGGEDQPPSAVFLRKVGGRLFPALSRPTVDWNVARARRSLEDSLRRLGRDHIDLYMLHEPEISLLIADEWLYWLETEVTVGRVRGFGIAVNADRLKPFLAAASPLAAIIQTQDSLVGRQADVILECGRPLQITYGYVSHAMRNQGPVDVPAVLAQALQRNATGAIIVSTRRPKRVPVYASLADKALG